jgi:hypothetical protein
MAIHWHKPAACGEQLDEQPGVQAQQQRELEESIYAIWRNVLRVQTVGPDDDFMGLGGNSLSAVRVVILTRAALEVAALPLQLIFEQPRAGDFAAAVLRLREGGAT